jgi:hypothetical protein
VSFPFFAPLAQRRPLVARRSDETAAEQQQQQDRHSTARAAANERRTGQGTQGNNNTEGSKEGGMF